MTLNFKPEPFARCYGWRIVFGLSMLVDGVLYLLSLTLFNASCTLRAARRLARSRLPDQSPRRTP